MSQHSPGASTPPPHSGTPWGYLPLPRPVPAVVPLRRALLWTAALSFLGVLAMAMMAILAGLLVLVIVWLIVIVFSDNEWHVWSDLASSGVIQDLLGPTTVVVLTASAGTFVVCAVALLLLRISDSVRRWAAPLQAITACGAVYTLGGMTRTLLSSLPSQVWD